MAGMTSSPIDYFDKSPPAQSKTKYSGTSGKSDGFFCLSGKYGLFV
jgi:hypothetical protein